MPDEHGRAACAHGVSIQDHPSTNNGPRVKRDVERGTERPYYHSSGCTPRGGEKGNTVVESSELAILVSRLFASMWYVHQRIFEGRAGVCIMCECKYLCVQWKSEQHFNTETKPRLRREGGGFTHASLTI